ncbi:MAG: Rieske 2Fe-2S domain-containing protein [Motilibacteraceae bacterium]
MDLSRPLDVVENAAVLDRVSGPLTRVVQSALGPRTLRDLLHGVQLGHPTHPALVQLPVGAFMSSALLDAVPGQERAATMLVGTGVFSALPAAVAGLADWSQMHPQQQRVGIVHAGSNVVGLSLYAASLVARLRGGHGRGKTLALAGLTALSAGAFLGGHLSYRQAGGANHAEDVPHLVPSGWNDLCAVDDLPADGTPTRRELGDVPLLVVRSGDRVDVLSDRCSHLSGPLSEGELTEDGACIRCPWHASEFRLADGSVAHGPATAPVHAFDVRVTAGRVEVRLANAG